MPQSMIFLGSSYAPEVWFSLSKVLLDVTWSKIILCESQVCLTII